MIEEISIQLTNRLFLHCVILDADRESSHFALQPVQLSTDTYMNRWEIIRMRSSIDVEDDTIGKENSSHYYTFGEN